METDRVYRGMGKREVYWWLVVRTGFCFAVFGLGALLLVRTEAPRRRYVRATVHHSFWFFFELMHWVRGFTYEIEGRERLGRPGQLIIANHPTLIDVVMIIGLIPAGCVVKEALFPTRSCGVSSKPRVT